MDILRQVLLLVHLLGFAALFGGLLIQARSADKSVNALMRDGAGTAFLAGLALTGVLEAGDDDVDHAKIGVKLVVGLVILGLVMANLRKPKIADGIFYGIFALTLINVGVAIFWSSAHAG
ncbi:hypothetical protein ncot_03970 [Nocardioides sp. JQ2195]|uniref:hypothetical protein n=1 Tax=Nocardioides sp. JQ2195 TaxID=2592334 RepID=UPI00143EDCAA|nr:hypothetical protein [Nocardioides sp. JQ2195]QIX25845.1 hypothetical protein ncot_03970 [Nocardioides sp. JQ2195]